MKTASENMPKWEMIPATLPPGGLQCDSARSGPGDTKWVLGGPPVANRQAGTEVSPRGGRPRPLQRRLERVQFEPRRPGPTPGPGPIDPAERGNPQCCTCSAPPPPLPTSDVKLRCFVNLDGYAVENPEVPNWDSYPISWWIQDQLVTDLKVARKDLQGNFIDYAAQYERMLSLYEREHGAAIVGTYISGADCRTLLDMGSYPSEAIDYDSMLSNLMDPYDFTERAARVRIEDPEARQTFFNKLFDIVTSRRRPLVLLDDIRHRTRWVLPPDWPPALDYWRTTCDYLSELTDRFHHCGIRTIANVSALPLHMTDEDVRQVQDAVDGFSFEEPFVIRNTSHPRARLRWGIEDVYRPWLNAGKTVIFIPVLPTPRPEGETREEYFGALARLGAYQAALAMIIRNPGHRLFVAGLFQLAPALWIYWPSLLGDPSDDYTFLGQTTLTRPFANGRVTVAVSVDGQPPYNYCVELANGQQYGDLCTRP